MTQGEALSDLEAKPETDPDLVKALRILEKIELKSFMTHENQQLWNIKMGAAFMIALEEIKKLQEQVKDLNGIAQELESYKEMVRLLTQKAGYDA